MMCSRQDKSNALDLFFSRVAATATYHHHRHRHHYHYLVVFFYICGTNYGWIDLILSLIIFMFSRSRATQHKTIDTPPSCVNYQETPTSCRRRQQHQPVRHIIYQPEFRVVHNIKNTATGSVVKKHYKQCVCVSQGKNDPNKMFLEKDYNRGCFVAFYLTNKNMLFFVCCTRKSVNQNSMLCGFPCKIQKKNIKFLIVACCTKILINVTQVYSAFGTHIQHCTTLYQYIKYSKIRLLLKIPENSR